MKKLSILFVLLISFALSSSAQTYTFEASPNTGFFMVDSVDYVKGHYELKYEGRVSVDTLRKFSLVNIYTGQYLINSRYYDALGLASWNELSELLIDLKILQADIASGVPLDVYIQDQTTDRLSLYLAQTLGTIDSISLTVKDADSIHINTTIVPVAGNFICLQENGKITQEEILTVNLISGNDYAINLRVPLDYTYSNSAGCSVQNVDMDVLGTKALPIVFKVAPRGNYRWDITRMIVSMILTTAGDDGLFGDITALTNGQYFRKEDALNSQNLYYVIDNSDFRGEGFDVTYPTRSGGGGSYGFGARISFNGLDKSGVVIRLDGSNSDSFTSPVRDNLTGIVKYRIKVQGHVVLD